MDTLQIIDDHSSKSSFMVESTFFYIERGDTCSGRRSTGCPRSGALCKWLVLLVRLLPHPVARLWRFRSPPPCRRRCRSSPSALIGILCGDQTTSSFSCHCASGRGDRGSAHQHSSSVLSPRLKTFQHHLRPLFVQIFPPFFFSSFPSPPCQSNLKSPPSPPARRYDPALL